MKEINPWAGVTMPADAPKPAGPDIQRRDPVDQRLLETTEVLAGTRGDPNDYAVRRKELAVLVNNLTAQLRANSEAYIAAAVQKLEERFAAMDTEAKALVDIQNAAFDDAAKRSAEIDDEIARLDQYDAQLSITFTEQIGAVTATLEQNYYTIAETDLAISATTTDLSAAIGDVAANLANNYYTRAATDSALAAVQTSLSAQIGAVDANLQTYYYTIAETDQAIASQTSTLSSQINGLTTSVQTLTNTTNGIDGVYGVKVNNNGHVSGFGLISSLRSGVAVSDFIVSDASFKLVNTSGQGEYTPFAVYPTSRVVDGVTVPAGVYINQAYITSANIKTLNGDVIKARTIYSDRIVLRGVTSDLLADGATGFSAYTYQAAEAEAGYSTSPASSYGGSAISLTVNDPEVEGRRIRCEFSAEFRVTRSVPGYVTGSVKLVCGTSRSADYKFRQYVPTNNGVIRMPGQFTRTFTAPSGSFTVRCDMSVDIEGNDAHTASFGLRYREIYVTLRKDDR